VRSCGRLAVALRSVERIEEFGQVRVQGVGGGGALDKLREHVLAPHAAVIAKQQEQEPREQQSRADRLDTGHLEGTVEAAHKPRGLHRRNLCLLVEGGPHPLEESN
jgi:hypothetical protein